MSLATYTFFSLGGVLPEEFADPDAPGGTTVLPARFYLADPRESFDGLVREMARGLPPERRIPWIDRRARDVAISSLRAHSLGADAERYILSTPYFEGDADVAREGS